MKKVQRAVRRTFYQWLLIIRCQEQQAALLRRQRNGA